jgi:hypothetical protein
MDGVGAAPEIFPGAPGMAEDEEDLVRKEPLPFFGDTPELGFAQTGQEPLM